MHRVQSTRTSRGACDRSGMRLSRHWREGGRRDELRSWNSDRAWQNGLSRIADGRWGATTDRIDSRRHSFQLFAHLDVPPIFSVASRRRAQAVAACGVRAMAAVPDRLGVESGRSRGASAARRRRARSACRARALVARSRWHETPPVGGPRGRGRFSTGPCWLRLRSSPPALLAELLRIEARLGRVRTDALGGARRRSRRAAVRRRGVGSRSELAIPHPRMHYRRFVLAAGGRGRAVDGSSRERLDRRAAARATRPRRRRGRRRGGGPTAWRIGLMAQLERATPRRERRPRTARAAPLRWTTAASARGGPSCCSPSPARLAATRHEWRKMLHLPPTGPVAWLAPGDAEDDAARSDGRDRVGVAELTPIGGTNCDLQPAVDVQRPAPSRTSPVPTAIDTPA